MVVACLVLDVEQAKESQPADREMLTAKTLATVVHTSKMVLFVFDRVTGTLVYGLEERPVPSCAGDQNWIGSVEDAVR